MAQPVSIDMSWRCVEREPRLVGGRFGWAVHRFPIKGGITILQALNTDITEALAKQSTLLAKLQGRAR